MPAVNSVITYGDLNNSILTYIRSVSKTVDGNYLPGSLTGGYSIEVGRVNAGDGHSGYPPAVCTKRLNSTPISVVSYSTLTNLLTNFLSSKGIASNRIVSTQGILYYINAIAVFLENQLTYVGGVSTAIATKSYVSSSQVKGQYGEGTVTADMVNQAIDGLCSSICSLNKANNVSYSYSMTSCSSSSSSAFIVYYKL